jgi:acetyltransferase EpsM
MPNGDVVKGERKLIVWGASGHARVVTDIVRLQGEYTIVGYLDSINPSRKGEMFLGGMILGGDEQLGRLLERGVEYLIVGFGDCMSRIRAADEALSKGYKLVTALHPNAVIADDVKIGEGTVVAAGAVINPAAIIGRNVIVNTSSSVDHECQVGDGAHICPGAHLSGSVRVERAAWIGTGASVRDRVQIGAGSIIGVGAVVVDDIPAGVVAYGNPAKVRKRL